jgi:hypothetical protein
MPGKDVQASKLLARNGLLLAGSDFPGLLTLEVSGPAFAFDDLV